MICNVTKFVYGKGAIITTLYGMVANTTTIYGLVASINTTYDLVANISILSMAWSSIIQVLMLSITSMAWVPILINCYGLVAKYNGVHGMGAN